MRSIWIVFLSSENHEANPLFVNLNENKNKNGRNLSFDRLRDPGQNGCRRERGDMYITEYSGFSPPPTIYIFPAFLCSANSFPHSLTLFFLSPTLPSQNCQNLRVLMCSNSFFLIMDQLFFFYVCWSNSIQWKFQFPAKFWSPQRWLLAPWQIMIDDVPSRRCWLLASTQIDFLHEDLSLTRTFGTSSGALIAIVYESIRLAANRLLFPSNLTKRPLKNKLMSCTASSATSGMFKKNILELLQDPRLNHIQYTLFKEKYIYTGGFCKWQKL